MMTYSTWIFYLFVAFVKPGSKTTHNALIFAIIYFLELQFAMEYCQGGRLSWTDRHCTTRMYFRSYPSFLKEPCPTVS